jgi:hypothetical protein
VDPVPDPLFLRKSSSAGNRTRTSESVARNSDHYTTEAVHKDETLGGNYKERLVLPALRHLWLIRFQPGARGSVVVKALFYKPESRGFDSRRVEFLNLPNPSGRTRPQPLTGMSNRNIKIIMFLGSKVRREGKADNFTAIYEPIV